MKRISGFIFLLYGSLLASPVIDLDSDLLKFGYVSVGGEHPRSFQISNIGDENLIVDSLILPYAEFTVAPPQPPLIIPPGDSRGVEILFRPQAINTFDDDLIIFSNDPQNPEFSLRIIGQAVRPFEPGEVIWEFQAIDNVECVAATPDVDDDGFPDVIAESFGVPFYDTTLNHLTLLSGSGEGSPSLVWGARPWGGHNNRGSLGDQCLATVQDLSGDGIDDILFGANWDNWTVFTLDAVGGQDIWTAIIDSFPHAGGVTSVADMGDINGDGSSEVLAATDSRPGLAYCLDGASGQILWSFQADDAFLSADGIDDVDDDGINDALFGAGDPYEDRAFCVSGATGQQIWYYSTQGGTVWFVHSIKDINGDGYQDALLGTWTVASPVVAVSGHSSGVGEVIWSTPINGLNIRVIPCPDLNSDGLEDVLVGSCNQYALALSGDDGSEIWRYYTRSLNGGYVWAIDWVADITGDGIPEVAAGSFDYYLYLINGATGEHLWEFYTGNRIETVRSIGDINGDGFADVIAGTQYLGGTGGKVYLVSGGTVTTIVREYPQELPKKIQTLKNYPNPFNTCTTIFFNPEESEPAKLSIYDPSGRLVQEVSFIGKPNVTSWVWHGRDNRDLEVSSGIYFSRLDSDKMTYFGKMILIK